jgi:predicted RNA-binding Zn-ribbon protein involved in translation (DUF1610 family)
MSTNPFDKCKGKKCPKCNSNNITLDEGYESIFRCVKCRHVDNEYAFTPK